MHENNIRDKTLRRRASGDEPLGGGGVQLVRTMPACNVAISADGSVTHYCGVISFQVSEMASMVWWQAELVAEDPGRRAL